MKYIITPHGRAEKSGSSWLYYYNITDHLGNVRTEITPYIGGAPLATQKRNYYTFGMEMSQLNSGSVVNKYQYNGKELQDDFGLYWYDYGARFYDPMIGRWHSVDPMVHKREWLSPYNFCSLDPINRTDPTGALDDWFQNEKTGDVYFNSEMRKGDEGTGVMKGEGWKHLGENNMFSDGSPTTSDASILLKNQGLGEVSMTTNYDKFSGADTKATSVSMTGMFKGDNAKKLMSGLGYDFKPVLFKFHSDVTTEYHPETHGQTTITHDNSKVEEVLSSRYISQDLVLKNTQILGNYKNPILPVAKSFGPMYSIRDQSWTIRQNVYGTHAFGRKFGKTISTLEKIVPWKSAYENLLKKSIK